MMQVALDPYVALAILDHHQRRGDGMDRVTGLLLGSTVKNVVQVRNYVPSMTQGFVQSVQRASPKDLPVGWYATGTAANDREIEEETVKQATQRPVFLVVDIPKKDGDELNFRAYQTTQVILSTNEQASILRKLPITYTSVDPSSSVIVDTIVRSEFPEVAQASDPTSLPATVDADDRLAQLRNIASNLAVTKSYVDDVVSKKRTGDIEVGSQIAAALELLGNVRKTGDAMTDEGNESLNDALVLQYISTLLNHQVASIEKLASRTNKA